jgi:hypothetical protein
MGPLGDLTNENFNFSEEFSTTSFREWNDSMIFLPGSTVAELIFGSGRDIASSDLGYVKMVSMVGFLGLGITLLFYAYIWRSAITWRIPHRDAGTVEPDSDRRGWKAIKFSLIGIVLLLFVVNLKNLYFFTRGYHELCMVLYFCGLRYWKVTQMTPR